MDNLASEEAIRTTIYLTKTNKRHLEDSKINMTRFFNDYCTAYFSSDRNESKLRRELNDIQEREVQIKSMLNEMKQENKQQDTFQSMKESALRKIVRGWLQQARYDHDDSKARWWLGTAMLETVSLAGFNDPEDALIWLRKLDRPEKCEEWLDEHGVDTP